MRGQAEFVESSDVARAADLRRRVDSAASTARIFDDSVDLVLVIGSDALLLHVSSGWTRMLGATDAPRLGLPFNEALPTGWLASANWGAFDRAFAAALQDGSSALIPVTFEHPERGRRQLEGRLYRPRDDTGNVVIVFHDVTSSAAETLALVQSERRFRIIAEASRDMVTESNSKGRFTYVSPACTRVLGYSAEEFLSRSPLDLHHDDDREVFVQELLAQREPGEPFSMRPHRLRRKDGSWIWVEATAVHYRRSDGEVRLVGVARDITSRRRAETARQQLEERLHQSQKLESLGVMAGGIAHDFNNYLAPIVGAASSIDAELPGESPFLPRVALIRDAARRASELTAQIMAYAGGGEPRIAAVDLSEAVLRMRPLLESTANDRAKLFYELAAGLPPAAADDAQIGQVVMNLVVNASEALGTNGGTITIRSGQLSADRDDLLDYHLGDARDEGVYVYLEVCDDGMGLDESTRERIFDPFFSTKFTGRGLGLPVVLGIVKRHHGALRIDSSPGAGATFRVLLPTAPVASVAVDASIGEGLDVRSRAASRAQSGTFLVVDDDEGAREITSLLLERAGFEVLAEAGGAEAIEVFRQSPARICGVVLDQTMPGLSGAQVFAAIREIAPEVPIIVASGYSRERLAESLPADARTCFLRKPFDADQLLAVVRQLIDTRPDPGADR